MIRQISVEKSISRILATPLGSRVMMPEYGSRLFELIDKTVTDEWRLDAIRYTSEAIEINEPRCILKNVQIEVGDEAIFKIGYIENGIYKTMNLGYEEVIDAAA